MAIINHKETFFFPSSHMSEREKDMFIIDKQQITAKEALKFGGHKVSTDFTFESNIGQSNVNNITINASYLIMSTEQLFELENAINRGDTETALRIIKS